MSVASPERPDLGAPEPKQSMSFAKKAIIAAVGLLILGTAIGSALQPSPEVAAPSPSSVIEESAVPEPSDTPEPSEAAEPTKAPEPSEAPQVVEPVFTVSQENAIQTAKDYLDFSAFSKSGLIDQLEFEGYSKVDADFAVNHFWVNWNQQAAKSAKDYLEYSSFSRQGLIDQLEFEGFTTQQAIFGVNTTGL